MKARQGGAVVGHSTTWPASLLKDLRTSDDAASSYPEKLTVVGNTAFFVASTEETGAELWKTDGTAAGTVLVKDIVPGPYGSSPSWLTAVGNTLFFTAWQPLTGIELWKSDGTAAGTTLIKDLNPGPYDIFLYGTPAASNGNLFFATSDPALGTELWKSDGTAAGTMLVKDIYPGAESGAPYWLVDMNGTLFFAAHTPGAGVELWRSDGTTEGTTLVKDIHPSGGSFPAVLTVVGNTLFFSASSAAEGGELWKSDGTAAGTTLVKDIAPGPDGSIPWGSQHMKAVGTRLFFTAATSDNGIGLYVSDGTAAGTLLLKPPAPSANGYNLANLVEHGNTLYFTDMESSTGNELWKSDGTVAGTTLVKDLAPGAGSSYPRLLASLGGELYFTADVDSCRKLLRTDGTEEGTVVVGPCISPYSEEKEFLVAFGGQLLFRGTQGTTGYELWRSDGTAAGTTLLKDINPSRPSSAPLELVSTGGTLFFTAGIAPLSESLFKSDGTAAGTVELRNPDPAQQSHIHQKLTPVGNTLFLVMYTPASGLELHKSDGTPEGTVLVKDLIPGPGGSYPSSLTHVGNTLFFTAQTTTQGYALYKSDGTATGTVLVKHGSFAELVNINGTLFLTDFDYRLWRSDGTTAGTRELVVLSGPQPSRPHSLVALGNTLYFFASGGSAGGTLWRSNGTPAGTVVVKDFNQGTRDEPYLGSLTRVGNRLFFVADNRSGTGAELWVSDGTTTGTRLVKDIWPGANSSRIIHIIDVNGVAYFGALTPEAGYELWKSDGTAAGTVLVKDLWPGPESGLSAVPYQQPMLSLSPEGVLLFTATDGSSGLELWRSNGTAAGTQRLQDIAPGAASSNPKKYTRAGDLVFFTADDGTLGREPWVARVSDLADYAPPTVSCPAHQAAEASSASGATVSYPPATAADNSGRAPVLSYSHASGSAFPFGNTVVTVTAQDLFGYSASCSFTITVRDTTAPTVSCPASQVIEATSSAGASVSFPAATASDTISTPTLTYSQTSGSTFPLGSTTATATATDSAGNSTSCTFSVVVRDTTPPVLTCPANQVAEATSASGAAVTYPPATASDTVSTTALSYSQPSGSAFALGNTVTTATASDASGNTSTCTFTVLVRDTTPPALSCPADITVQAVGAQGATVTWPAATATDAATPSPTLSYSSASGSRFPVGDTTVNVTAVDGTGLQSTCTFVVRVTPATSSGCTAMPGSTSLWGLMGVLLLAVRRRRASH